MSHLTKFEQYVLTLASSHILHSGYFNQDKIIKEAKYLLEGAIKEELESSLVKVDSQNEDYDPFI